MDKSGGERSQQIRRRAGKVAEAIRSVLESIDARLAPAALCEELAASASDLTRLDSVNAIAAVERAENALEALREWLTGR